MYVAFEIAFLSKCFTAHATLERFLARVDAFVIFDMAFLSKCFVAVGTLERFANPNMERVAFGYANQPFFGHGVKRKDELKFSFLVAGHVQLVVS